MFIAIDAKADIEGSKKGKLTPAQHAQINSWVFSKKTGILDCFDKCDTTDISYTAVNNIATVIFKKGFIVICGRLVECEQGTEVKIQTPVSGSVSGRIVLRFSLSSTQEEEFKVVVKTGRSLTLNDLNENSSTGVYEFPLYDYIATPNNVSLMNKNISYVRSTNQEITALSGMITAISNSIEGNKDAPLYDYNKNKGTIEQRLTNLGFKQGSITGVSGATLTKQGKYAILTIP